MRETVDPLTFTGDTRAVSLIRCLIEGIFLSV